MKLLTTIAAVLISISAYSQDLIEYDNGTFSKNGEQLSMEQIDDLTLLHKAGRGNFWRGFRFNRMHKDVELRVVNNFANLAGGAGVAYVGGYSALGGLILTTGGFYVNSVPAIGVPIIAAGTGLCIASYRAFSRITLSKKGCLPRRDREFEKVADKINQAIHDSNQ